jgi:hypothetical protein
MNEKGTITEVRDLRKSLGRSDAVEGISFDILGPNDHHEFLLLPFLSFSGG